MKRFLIGYALLTTCLLFMQRSIIDEQQKPLLVYHADSKYAITGKVEEKRKIGSLFTNKEDTKDDVLDLIERCSTLDELKSELTEYFDLEEM